MSALGQKQTCTVQKVMSALHPIADMRSAVRHVRFVPLATLASKFGTLGKRLLKPQAERRQGEDHEKYCKEYNFH